MLVNTFKSGAHNVCTNGDKARFNRQRKQKIARRKHAHELLDRVVKARKSADATVRAQPRSVSV